MDSMLMDLQVVVFRVGDGEFGININQVLSIERMEQVNDIPKTPDYMVGMVNLRGKITPVIDLGKVLIDRFTQKTEATRIIIANMEGQPIGLIVNAATDVLNIPSQSIQKLNLINEDNISYLHGVAKMKNRLLVLIDINELLSNIADIGNIRKVLQITSKEGN